MTESEIKNAIKTINAQLENALQKEKETEGTKDTVIWHLVANDYKCAIKSLEEIQQYRAIGTVEECQEARERQIPKKPVKYGDTRQGLGNDGNSISLQQDCYECPTCGSFLGYVSDCEDEEYQDGCCRNCGQAILWEEELCQ